MELSSEDDDELAKATYAPPEGEPMDIEAVIAAS